MSTLTLELRDAQGAERFPGVTAFVGADASGSFGLRPGHARFITTLAFGLARFRVDSEPWQYLALPGAVLHLQGERLRVTSRRYLRDTDYGRISEALGAQLRAEEQALLNRQTLLSNQEIGAFFSYPAVVIASGT